MNSLQQFLGRIAVSVALLWPASMAHAGTLTLDDFSSLAIPLTGTPNGTGAQFYGQTFGTYAGVPSLTRAPGELRLVWGPLSSGATVGAGGGDARVHAGPGALGEYVISHGAFTRPGDPLIAGPPMNLDL